MVVMDLQDYNNKAQALLQDTNTYKVLPKDPTPQLKNKLITLLKNIHQTGGLSTHKYKQLYPTSAIPPKFYGLPKIHKTGIPLRPIVSSRGSITYGVAKELSHIIKPLVGQSPHHLKNTQHFIQQIQGKRLQTGDSITSFDVKALFTSVPVQSAIQIVKNRLQQDSTLPQRTAMSIPQITSLLEFCLTQTYFLFQGKYYQQTQGAAMGSPISPIIANIFMEEFEVKALQSFPNPPSMWLRFVDDTFVINKAEHSRDLLQHINNQDPHIQFTVEPTQQGSLPFLDTLVTIQPENTLSTSVYRKPTHTDQYLHWDSNHHITAKHSVYSTLAHRAKTVSSTQDSLDKELLHIKQLYTTVNSQTGHSTNGNTNSNIPIRSPTLIPTTPATQTATRTITTSTVQPLLFLTSPTLLTDSKGCAKEGTYRYSSKAQTPLEQPWLILRTGTTKPNKLELSTNISALTYIVPAHTLGSLADPWEKG